MISDSSGLGVNFALYRGAEASGRRRTGPRRCSGAGVDLAAVSRLDEIRTIDLTQSRENLKPIELEQNPGYDALIACVSRGSSPFG